MEDKSQEVLGNESSDDNKWITLKGQDGRFVQIPKSWGQPYIVIIKILTIIMLLMAALDLFVFTK